MELEALLRLYHWSTHSFARHKASCEAIADVIASMDTVIETLLGHYGRDSILPDKVQIQVPKVSDEAIKTYIEQAKGTLRKWDSIFVGRTDILNLRDDLLGKLTHFE